MAEYPGSETERIARKYLDADFNVLACGNKTPSKAEVISVARKHGCAFPEEFIQHATCSMGALYVEVKEDIWPRAEVFAVGPSWSFYYGVLTYGLGAEVPDWMNIDARAEQFLSETGLKAVPFLKVLGSANDYCFGPDGGILQYEHDVNELHPRKTTFYDLLEFELSELAERKERKKATVEIEDEAAQSTEYIPFYSAKREGKGALSSEELIAWTAGRDDIAHVGKPVRDNPFMPGEKLVLEGREEFNILSEGEVVGTVTWSNTSGSVVADGTHPAIQSVMEQLCHDLSLKLKCSVRGVSRDG